MKKFIALILMLSSISAFSSDSGVLDAMKSMFREGFYFGMTPAPNANLCTVRFEYFTDRAVVTSTNTELAVSRIIPADSSYRFQAGRREFLSSDNASTFRSLAVNEVDTYTVTSTRDADGSESYVECIIPLE